MLGKVIKNEFKDTWKVLLPLNLALIIVTVFGLIALGIFRLKDETAGIIVAATGITYMLGLIAVVVTCFIYLAVRFYKSMYGAEGYLTHTLPVSGFCNLHGKLIVAVLWYMISMLLAITAVFTLAFALVRNVGGVAGDMITFDMMITEFEIMFDAPIGILLLKVFGYVFLSAISGLLMVYACLSIGQLFNKYKIGAAVVTYIIFYLIVQIITFLMMLSTQIGQLNKMENQLTLMEVNGGSLGVMPEMTGSIILSVVMIVIYYVITAYICNRKLNLD